MLTRETHENSAIIYKQNIVVLFAVLGQLGGRLNMCTCPHTHNTTRKAVFSTTTSRVFCEKKQKGEHFMVSDVIWMHRWRA